MGAGSGWSRSDAGARDEEFSAFVAGSSRRLLHIARVVSGDEHIAEDLVQTALVGAYSRWDRIQSEDPFAYVRRSVVNAAAARWRRRRVLREDPVAELPEWSSLHDLSADAERRDLLLRVLRGLTARERAVLALRFYEDLSERQTAHELGITTGTVKSTTSRALAKLRLSPALADALPLPGNDGGAA